MILENVGWGTHGKGDAAGRNAFAYICWPNETWLKDTIMQCVKQRDDSFIQFYRYPGQGADTISRDHVGAIILALYINQDWDELKWILDNLPWRLSRKYQQTIDFWLWQKSLKHKSWWIAQIFFLTVIFQLVLIIPWNWLLRRILGFKIIKPEDVNKPFKPIQKFRWINSCIYPHYALFLLAWQVKSLPGSILKWICNQLIRVEARNPIIKRIAGKKLSLEDYENYVPIAGFQWAGTLDRGVFHGLPRKLKEDETKQNDITKGMLDYFWFNIDKIDPKLMPLLKQSKPIIQY